MCIVFLSNQPITIIWFNYTHYFVSLYNAWLNTLLLVGLTKIQYTRDDEPTTFCLNQDKNIDNEAYCVSTKSFLTCLLYSLWPNPPIPIFVTLLFKSWTPDFSKTFFLVGWGKKKYNTQATMKKHISEQT